MELIRNEMEVEIGGKKILLRADFDSLRKFEQAVGGMGAFIKPIATTGMINLTDSVLLIYHTQAPENSVKYSQDECFSLVMSEGMAVAKKLMVYVAMLTAGNKRVDGLGDASKKE